MSDVTRKLAADVWASIGGNAAALEALSVSGDGDLPSRFAVTDLASATIGVAGLAVADPCHRLSHRCDGNPIDDQKNCPRNGIACTGVAGAHRQAAHRCRNVTRPGTIEHGDFVHDIEQTDWGSA